VKKLVDLGGPLPQEVEILRIAFCLEPVHAPLDAALQSAALITAQVKAALLRNGVQQQLKRSVLFGFLHLSSRHPSAAELGERSSYFAQRKGVVHAAGFYGSSWHRRKLGICGRLRQGGAPGFFDGAQAGGAVTARPAKYNTNA